MYPSWANVTDRDTANPLFEATDNVNNLTNKEENLAATDSHVAEEKTPELIPDLNLYQHPLSAAINFSKYLDLTHGFTKRLDEGQENVTDSRAEIMVNRASELLSEDSPMTADWPSEHLRAAKLITNFPELAQHLNQNPDLAQRFMQSIEEVKTILGGFFDEKASELAGQFLNDDSPITYDWLYENLGAANFIAKHPRFAAYLNENLEQADKFVSVSA